MVSQHIALVALVTPIGFYMDGSAAQIPHGLGQCPIETILHGVDLHVLQWGDEPTLYSPSFNMKGKVEATLKHTSKMRGAYRLNLKADFLTESHARDVHLTRRVDA